jgi:ribonucleoside-diphosphate reductase alpha chain
MQACLQKHIDSSISKTINMPKSATQKNVRDAYLLAYQSGCKGITVYRDGSRPIQVLSTKKEEDAAVRYRSKRVVGHTDKIKTPLGKLYLTINKNKNGDTEPIEVILNMGKTGTSINSFVEAVGRLISLHLKNKTSTRFVAKAITGIKSEDVGFNDEFKYSSIPDLIGKMLLKDCEQKEESEEILICPDCDSKLRVQEGCVSCSCGYAKC